MDIASSCLANCQMTTKENASDISEIGQIKLMGEVLRGKFEISIPIKQLPFYLVATMWQEIRFYIF